MKEVAILVPPKALLSSVEDARYLFSMVNEYQNKKAGAPLFNVRLVGLTKEVKLEKGLYSITTDELISDSSGPDLIIIPSMTGDMITSLVLNLNFVPWIIRNYEQGAEVASLCVGSFLLACTGLLKGNECSTHWKYANEFSAFFPGVKLVDDKIITDHNRLYTSGGSTSYWNLLLHLVEKNTDRETAIWISKYFALDVERTSQSPFAIFGGQKEHNDVLILGVQKFIEDHCHEKLAVEQLGEKFNITRRSLERRFRKATNNSIVEYIQRIKIEFAKKQLEGSSKTISGIMYDVGYSDPNAFRKVFKLITGITPLGYRNRYGKK